MQTSSALFHYTHLSAQESMDPMLAISRFCELFPPAAARQTLWLWLSETLAAEDTHYENAPAQGRPAFTLQRTAKIIGRQLPVKFGTACK